MPASRIALPVICHGVRAPISVTRWSRITASFALNAPISSRCPAHDGSSSSGGRRRAHASWDWHMESWRYAATSSRRGKPCACWSRCCHHTKTIQTCSPASDTCIRCRETSTAPRAFYDRALKQDPDRGVVAANLGVLYARRGSLARALDVWRDAFANNAQLSDLGLNLANGLCAAGDVGARVTWHGASSNTILIGAARTLLLLSPMRAAVQSNGETALSATRLRAGSRDRLCSRATSPHHFRGCGGWDTATSVNQSTRSRASRVSVRAFAAAVCHVPPPAVSTPQLRKPWRSRCC